LSPLQADGTSTLTLTIDPLAFVSDVSSDPTGSFEVTARSGSVMHYVWLYLTYVDRKNALEYDDEKGRFVDIVTPEGPDLRYVHSGDGDPNPTGGFPPGTSAVDFPVGFFGFQLDHLSPGQHVKVIMVLDLLPGEAIN
jgi:hypothetical protein